jgi:hypothetical protein
MFFVLMYSHVAAGVRNGGLNMECYAAAYRLPIALVVGNCLVAELFCRDTNFGICMMYLAELVQLQARRRSACCRTVPWALKSE